MGWRPGSQRRWQGENLERNQGVVEKIREIADAKGWTPGQFALAWVLARGETDPRHQAPRVSRGEPSGGRRAARRPEDLAWIDAHGRRPQATATMAS
jgi:diketogulonate reductase-like aldo/keto reductase